MIEKLKRFFKSIDVEKILKYLAIPPIVMGILGGIQYLTEKKTASAEVGDLTALEEYTVFDGTITVAGNTTKQVLIPSFAYVNLDNTVTSDYSISYDTSYCWFQLTSPKSNATGVEVFSFEVENTWLPMSYFYDYSSFELEFTGEVLYDVAFELSYLDAGANVRSIRDTFRGYDGYFEPSQVDSLQSIYTYTYNGVDWLFINHMELNVYYLSTAPSGAQNVFFFYVYYSTKPLQYTDFTHAQSNVQASYIQQFNADIDVWGGLVNSVTSILQLEILPNFSFLNLLELAIAIPLTVWLLKAWLGG